MRNWNYFRESLGQKHQRRASRLPMRNWNLTELPHRTTRKALPDYLWGIETQEVGKIVILEPELPDYLWGIETLVEIQLTKPNVPLPDYLWGIETRQVYLGYRYALHASRLPMRNWNSQNSLKRPPESFCFQTTYEELKRNPYSNSEKDSQNSFQTTYEELKRFSYWPRVTSSPLPDYLWGIETCSGSISETSLFSKLPDYLWGIETSENWIWGNYRTTLPDYLWGIETFNESHDADDLRELPDYLWGIETLVILVDIFM